MSEWTLWSRAICHHTKLFMSGVASIILNAAQFILMPLITSGSVLKWVLFFVFGAVTLGCLYFASFFTWRDEHRKGQPREKLAAAFLESLERRCDDLISGWDDLDRRYLEADEGMKGSKTLQSPLDPGWCSSQLHYWPTQICSYQHLYGSLRKDLSALKIPLASHDRLTTMTQLRAMLSDHKEQIARLSFSERPS